MKNIMKKTYQLGLSVFGALLLFSGTFFVEVPRVVAAPLDPGACYSRTNGEFLPVSCPGQIQVAADQCVEVRQMPGGVSATQYFDIDCQTQNQGSKIEPDTTTDTGAQSDSEAGTLSGEGEEDRTVNACASGDTDCQKKTCKVGEREALSTENCIIVEYLVTGINILSALAGMAIIASIMMAGYQYMTAKDNSGQVEAARKRILWAMIALGIFLFMYSVLNWLVPGGVL
jgi:hypothetical protein